MKTFKEYIIEQSRTKEEELELAKNSPLFKHIKLKGWLVKSSIHASAQAEDRRKEFTLKDWKKLHIKGIAELESENVYPTSEFFLIYSKSQEQGYIVKVSWRRKDIRIITVLPKGKNTPKDGTSKLVVEGLEITNLVTLEVE